MQMKKIRNCLTFLVVFALFTLLVIYLVPTVQASEKKLDVLLEGQVVEEVQLEQEEKILLTTDAKGLEERSLQWQLLMNVQEAVWVDIYDRTEDSCEVSYALVKNMLDEADSVYVRCVAQGEGDDVCSNAVCVVVQPEKDEEATFSMTTFQTQHVQVANETEDDTTAEYVTITIKYLDSACYGQEEETAIYSPYVATIERGTEFKQDVVSPTFLGFAPYLMSEGEKGDDASVLTLNYPEVTKNIVIYVYYYPIEVNYAVKYFFQNVNDDLYTEDVARYQVSKAETGTIIANDELEALAGDTTGFTKMYHIPENVAADGSTVFECYYDRNYYLVEFDLDGGYGVEPVYARYGAAFVVNEPVRHGYQFAGWKLVKVDKDEDGTWDDVIPEGMSAEMVSNIPAYNCLYQAQWEKIATSYTVVYWLKRNDGTMQYLHGRTVSENVKSGDEVSGKNDLSEYSKKDDVWYDDLWYYEYIEADEKVLVEGDGSTIVNVYYKPKEYTLRFYYAASTEDEVKIIGGSTYIFGRGGSEEFDDVKLLDRTFTAEDRVGTVTKLPELNDEGKSRNYTFGTVQSDNTNYHYIEFTAEYGQNISELWPCSVFEPAEREKIDSNTNGWDGRKAFVAGWNGEYDVEYSKNPNQTIKGKYEKLDSKILLDNDNNKRVEVENRNKDKDGRIVVSYLCFWENGAGNVVWNIPKLFVYRIWVPVIPGEDETRLSQSTYNGVTYKLIDSYDTCDNSKVEEQTIPSLEGYTNVSRQETTDITFTEEQQQSYAECKGVDFYYRRNENAFVMRNYDDTIVNTTVAYGHQLSGLNEVKNKLGENYVPSYPKTLEENAYEFEGWYTTEKCIEGTKVNLSTYCMPDSGLILYANWVPKKHTVHFFTTYDEMKAYEEGTSKTIYKEYSVSHGNVIGSVETPVRSGDGEMTLIFAGWFYMEAGQKKAFSPLNIPVNKDLNLFAEWSSHSPQPYRIRYVSKNNPEISVADDTIGYAYGGSTRTFYAKAGKPFCQLKDEYNEGWFPTVSSHSITIQAEADKDHLKYNTYTFYYVEATEITYTVRYVNKETNELLSEETYKTSAAVVTERFKAYENMVPDAFYKRLVLEVKEDDKGNYVGTENNVITFYYTPNKTSAFYAVHYMLEKADATETQKLQYEIDGTGGYEEAVTHEEAVGQIGNTISIQPQRISGFTLIEDNKNVPIVSDGNNQKVAPKDSGGKGYQIQITKDGTELYLFYKRNTYPYVVHYYVYNTTTPVKGYKDKTESAPYGSEVTEEAVSIAEYTCVSERTQTITIREDDGTTGLNDIIFYYAPIQYVVEYKAVPEEGGWLSNTIEVKAGKEFEGSVPMPGAYYKFAGWYQDEKCTEPVSGKLVDESNYRLNPNLADLSETESNIFYAKFERKVGDFTIKRENVTDKTQVFVYEIKNVDTNETINVTITGNGSVTIKNLPFGKYTVTQQNGWSWRYKDIYQTLEHTGEHGTSCQFSTEENLKNWLNGNSSVVKNQRGQSE